MHFIHPAMALLSAVSLLALPAFAAEPAPDFKPGLWEITSKVGSADPAVDQTMAALLNQVANLPPDQRQQLEAMAAQQGMTMPKIGQGGAIAVNSCITAAMAAQKQIPTGQTGDCTSNNQSVAGGMQIAFTCKNPASSGRGQLRYVGDRGFTMSLAVTTSARGTPERLTITSAGKWLASSCASKAQ